MDTRQLKHLVALVELGTVHAAAEDQFISQPGLSGSIKRLEAQLGLVLFERDGRGMQPNAKGKELYRHAKLILEQVRLARADLAGEPTNLIVGLGEVRPTGFVGAFHDSLLESYPDLSLSFVEGNFESLCTQVENGDVDVAFVTAAPERLPATLLRQLLFKSQYIVFCSANNPLRDKQGDVPMSELKQFGWVRNGAAPVTARFFPDFIGHEKDPLGDVRCVTAGSQQMAIDLVLHSHLLGYGPRVVLDSELASGQAIELDLHISKWYITITEIRRRDVYSKVLDRAFAIAEEYCQSRTFV